MLSGEVIALIVIFGFAALMAVGAYWLMRGKFSKKGSPPTDDSPPEY